MIRRLHACIVTLTLAGTGASGLSAQRPTRSADIITREQIRDGASGASNALDIVRSLRPAWLRPPGVTSLRSAIPIRLYIDNMSQGDVTFMESVASQGIEEIWYFDAIEATSRWGTGNTAGAIQIVIAQRRLEEEPAQPRREAPVAGPSVAARDTDVYRYNPFRVGVVFIANSGAARFFRPVEKQSVWDPAVSAGLGLGVRASPRLTVFGILEYHHLSFSHAGALEYLLTQDDGRRRLNSAEGVLLQGDPNKIMNVSANVKFDATRTRVRPYLLLGIGYARLNTGDFTISSDDGGPLPRPQFPPQVLNGGNQLENAFTYSAGFGLEANVAGPVRVFVDVRYVEAVRGPRYSDVFARNQLFNTEFLPLRIGLTVN